VAGPSFGFFLVKIHIVRVYDSQATFNIKRIFAQTTKRE